MSIQEILLHLQIPMLDGQMHLDHIVAVIGRSLDSCALMSGECHNILMASGDGIYEVIAIAKCIVGHIS